MKINSRYDFQINKYDEPYVTVTRTDEDILDELFPRCTNEGMVKHFQSLFGIVQAST